MENLIFLNTSSTKNILVAEDHLPTLKGLGLLLQPFANITAVSSGNQAIELLKTQKFDVVVTDYQMNDGNGLDIVKFICENKINSPVIMITSKGTKELAIEGIKYKIFGFIEKPFVREDIEETVMAGLLKKEEDDSTKNFAEVGENASELIHDIVNPLTVIGFKASQIKEQAEENKDSALVETVDKLVKNATRIETLIRAAKDILRKGKNNSNFKVFSVGEILADLKEACAAKATECKVPVVISPDLKLNLYGDKDQLLRAFINLVNNSIDAVAQNKEKWVHLEIQKKFKFIEVRITDSGSGIPEAIRDQIFKPLFSTKGEQGTGLGLKIVWDIIKSHGGLISINTNSPNTQFIVKLPITS